MSHITGTVQAVSPAIVIGPDSGLPASSPNTWTLDYTYAATPAIPPDLTGTKLIMLHFTGASLPAGNRLEVDLGYGMDVFTSADGSDFWTRPINVYMFPDGKVHIRYITNGATTGGVRFDKYGRGERHTKDPVNTSSLFDSLSNCDPFLGASPYPEPEYAKFWFCNNPPNWENAAKVVASADIRHVVAPSVGMIIHMDYNSVLGEVLSTCSVTLVDYDGTNDVVITAGHCMTDPIEDARSASIIFGYQTNADGTVPAGYSPVVVKVKEVIRQRFADGTANDYCLLRLKTPVTGITPRPMRTDVPASGEQVFGIHHPNGAIKKLSIPHPGYATVISSGTSSISVSLDVSGGSSGSGLFDMSGRLTGVLSNGVACGLSYYPAATILQDVAAPPAITRDVMLVFDRSGSMSLPGNSGHTKMEEARAAASLFVQLVRAGTGNRVGLVSFSTTASLPVDFALTQVTAASKDTLVGPAPYTTGLIGGLAPGGSTSMGGGINAAYAQLMPGSNPRNVLLFTDGMQNTPPMVNPADTSPANISVDVIGYGTPANLDGAMLTALASNHNGQYVMADTTLRLQKFFALAFGNIFESGSLFDPEYVLPKGQRAAAPVPFNVCEEETITVILGWDNREAQLLLTVTTPLGATLTSGSPSVESSSSDNWAFLRVPLPQAGERDGTWQVTVSRPGGGGEFPPPMPEVRYFINVVAKGGALLRRMPDSRKYYTGDAINPLVSLQYTQGGLPPNAKLQLTVSRPDASVGNLLSQQGLGGALAIDADTIPARQATLMVIEQRTGKSSVGYTQHNFDLTDDLTITGAMEPAGLFGNLLTDLLTVEGNYTFHAKATYGKNCTATREAMWSLHVQAGVDATRTTVTTAVSGGTGTITFVPKDKYGNNVGPGMGGDLTVSGTSGTAITGPMTDNGDGSYTVPVAWNPSSGGSPGVVIGQPGRPPVAVQGQKPPRKGCWEKWKWLWLLILIMLLLLLFWLLK